MFFYKNAIKSVIVDAKIARGRDIVIEFAPRILEGEDRIGRAFDLAVNGAANNILKEFNCNEY